jgi:hypothetical protein
MYATKNTVGGILLLTFSREDSIKIKIKMWSKFVRLKIVSVADSYEHGNAASVPLKSLKCVDIYLLPEKYSMYYNRMDLTRLSKRIFIRPRTVINISTTLTLDGNRDDFQIMSRIANVFCTILADAAEV